jgi:GMP synthase (glutamine-hydrolysing)
MTQPTCLIFRHLEFEDLGAFAAPLTAAGFVVETVAPYDGLGSHDPRAADLLIVLGGPIGVYEADRYPWTVGETRFIADRLAAGLPMFGICLGAQFMAQAAGARVYPGEIKEIGFAPIALTAAGHASPLAPFAQEPVTLHWHGDTFALPAGATLLAGSAAYAHQAFRLAPGQIATQFHPEAGGPGFERWLVGHTLELSAAGVDVAALRAEAARRGPDLKAKAEQVFALFLAEAGLT